jgi:aryl-alcohol dehydrogenase-like predicted oxidoreductase
MTIQAATTMAIGPDLTVGRMGYGALQLTDPDVWRGPNDRPNAIAVARRAVELGATLIDTADSYGLGANEELIAEALHPYSEEVVIATKAGQCHPGIGEWVPLGRPEYLRQQAELSLRRLRVDCLDLFQLHRVDPLVPLAEQVGALKQLQEEGTVRHVGLSAVTVGQIEAARKVVDIASVQNRFNVADVECRDVVTYCAREGLAFIAYEPIANGGHAHARGALAAIAAELKATVAQVALAWVLQEAPNAIPIPGTCSIAHLEENMAALDLELSAEHLAQLASNAA